MRTVAVFTVAVFLGAGFVLGTGVVQVVRVWVETTMGGV